MTLIVNQFSHSSVKCSDGCLCRKRLFRYKCYSMAMKPKKPFITTKALALQSGFGTEPIPGRDVFRQVNACASRSECEPASRNIWRFAHAAVLE